MVERCELTADERAVYDTVRAAVVSSVVAELEESNNVLAALEALLRLRQAACHAGLVPGQAAASSYADVCKHAPMTNVANTQMMKSCCFLCRIFH